MRLRNDSHGLVPWKKTIFQFFRKTFNAALCVYVCRKGFILWASRNQIKLGNSSSLRQKIYDVAQFNETLEKSIAILFQVTWAWLLELEHIFEKVGARLLRVAAAVCMHLIALCINKETRSIYRFAFGVKIVSQCLVGLGHLIEHVHMKNFEHFIPHSTAVITCDLWFNLFADYIALSTTKRVG